MDNMAIVTAVSVLVVLSLMFSFLGVFISVASHFRMIMVLREIRMTQAAVKESR